MLPVAQRPAAGTKTRQMIDLICRPQGATTAELADVIDAPTRNVGSYIAHLRKQLRGTTYWILSTKEGRDNVYKIVQTNAPRK